MAPRVITGTDLLFHQVRSDNRGYTMWVCPYCDCPYWNTGSVSAQREAWKQHAQVCLARRRAHGDQDPVGPS